MSASDMPLPQGQNVPNSKTVAVFVSSCVSAAEKESIGEDHREKKYKAHIQLGDRRGGVIGACTYFYGDEAKCDQHMETFIKCIKASADMWSGSAESLIKAEMTCSGSDLSITGGSSIDGFSAIKMTALGRPHFLLGELEPLLKTFTSEEEKQMKRMLQRVDVLVKHAIENGVRLMVDAEQIYFQPAISRLALEMQRLYNKEKPVIFQ